MMDAANIYPLGFHPIRDLFLHDVTTTAPIIPRSMVGVKYCFVDYGISSYFPPGSQEKLVLGTKGRDQSVPELSNEVPYDPFKVDIFSIGNVFRRSFRDVCLLLLVEHDVANHLCRNTLIANFSLQSLKP